MELQSFQILKIFYLGRVELKETHIHLMLKCKVLIRQNITPGSYAIVIALECSEGEEIIYDILSAKLVSNLMHFVQLVLL